MPLPAVRRAAWLAQCLGARIVLLHVAANPADGEAEWRRLCDSLMPLLEGVPVTPVLRHGIPVSQILAVAREENADLIVMTRHGRWQGAGGRMFHRFVLHSVVACTVEDAGCPVWIEPEGQGPPLRRLVCGITSLLRDRDLVALAGRLAEKTGARLVLFRNALKAEISVPGRSRMPESWQQEMVRAVAGDLERLRGELQADISVSIGDFLPVLLEQAGADSLIALRRTSAQWREEEFVAAAVRGTTGPVLVCPDLRRPRPVRTVGRPLPPSRLAGLARTGLMVLVLLIGILAVRKIWDMATDPGCGSAYQCDLKAGLAETARQRPDAKRPSAGPAQVSPPASGANP